MWEVVYTMTPDRGYFDRGETAFRDYGVAPEAIHSMEFVADGSVVIVYELDGDAEAVRAALETGSGERVEDYLVTDDAGTLVVQLRFYPDETFEEIVSLHRSFGVSVQYPIRYVRTDPSTVELSEIGPREELRSRIEATRDLATIEIKQVGRYDQATERFFRELTDRQQEVLQAAVEAGYYRIPRDATHEAIADELACSASTVGQHLRRIEATLVSSIVPDAGSVEEDDRRTRR